MAGNLHRDGRNEPAVILAIPRPAKERTLSFFEDDEPRTRTRPRRPAADPLAPTDPQQLLVRRAVAAGVGLLVIVLLVVFVRGCLSSAKEQALKDYNRNVAGVVQSANENTASFFDTLTAGGSSPSDLQTQVNQLRVRAEMQTRDAVKLDVPDEMKTPHRNLVLTLSLLQEAIGKVAEKIPSALASNSNVATSAVKSIAGEMQAFTAGDVVYQRRVAALIQQILNGQNITATVQTSSFQQNLGWLDPNIVARRIGSDAGRGAGGGATGQAAPGTHGHQLVSSSVAGKTLVAGGASNRIAVSSSLAFKVVIANQGENIETDVRVRVKISGPNIKTITAQKTVNQTRPGTNAEVAVPLDQPPPIGEPVTITVEVPGVLGEKKTDNNSQTYTALFERG